MGMQTLMPDGKLMTEFFETEEKMAKRRKQLESQGGKVQRVVRVHTNPKINPRYPVPHQGKQECARRVRQMKRDGILA